MTYEDLAKNVRHAIASGCGCSDYDGDSRCALDGADGCACMNDAKECMGVVADAIRDPTPEMDWAMRRHAEGRENIWFADLYRVAIDASPLMGDDADG